MTKSPCGTDPTQPTEPADPVGPADSVGSKNWPKDWRDIARLGKNSGWRYVAGVTFFALSVLGIGGVLTTLATVLILSVRGVPPEAWPVAIHALFREPSILGFVLNNLIFLFGLAALGRILPILHQRSFWTLLGHRQRLRTRRLLSAFGFHFGMLSLVGAIAYGLSPDNFSFTFQPRLWFGLLLVSLPLTFLQVSCEELFFRGYLLQGLGLRIRSRGLLTLLTALPFAAVHFWNPEMLNGWGMGLYYFSYGVVTSWLTLKDNGLELALGFHLATNFFGILVISAVNSALPVPSMFTVDAGGSPLGTVLLFWLEAALFYYVLLGRRAR